MGTRRHCSIRCIVITLHYILVRLWYFLNQYLYYIRYDPRLQCSLPAPRTIAVEGDSSTVGITITKSVLPLSG